MTDRRNGLRNRGCLPLNAQCSNPTTPPLLKGGEGGLLLYALCFMLFALCWFPLSLEAKVTGVCSNCHTMHNSQNGSAVARGDAPWGGTGGSTDARPNLLVASCLGCHSSTVASEGIKEIGGTKIPIVFNTVEPTYGAKGLAAGNFYWVTSDVGIAPNLPHDTKGHNIFATNQENNLNPVKAPGDTGVGSPCSSSSCHNNLDTTVSGTDNDLNGRQGCTKCHLFTGTDGYAKWSGYHHTNDGTGTKYVDSQAKGWYRFLSGHYFGKNNGVAGIEDEDWQFNPTANDHNEYLGISGDKISYGGFANIGGNSMTAYCTGCHGGFHAQDSTTVGASPWLRHPSDQILPTLGEYTAYTTYNPLVPVSRPSGFNWAGGPSSTVSGTNGDMVMCLSCHRAHASPYFKMMRWDYKGWPTSVTNGCNVCHTTKG